MGEPEQLIAEPDEVEEQEVVEGLHPPTLQQQNPRLISVFITTGMCNTNLGSGLKMQITKKRIQCNILISK